MTEAEALELVAQAAHDVRNAVLFMTDLERPRWAMMREQEREKVRSEVRAVWSSPASAAQQHEAWVLERQNAGWRYGPFFDVVAKTDPDLVPFQRLRAREQIATRLFHGIARVGQKLLVK